MDEFRTLLRSRLTERGSLARLAVESGIASNVIGRWRDGIGRPTDTNLKRLAPALGVAYEDLAKMCNYLPSAFPVDSPDDADLAADKFAGALRGVPRRFWHAVVEASIALAKAYEDAPVESVIAPADAITHPVRPAKASRRSVNSRSGPDDPTLDNTLQSHWNGLHPLKAALAMSS